MGCINVSASGRTNLRLRASPSFIFIIIDSFLLAWPCVPFEEKEIRSRLETIFHTPLKKKKWRCSLPVLDRSHTAVINPDGEPQLRVIKDDTTNYCNDDFWSYSGATESARACLAVFAMCVPCSRFCQCVDYVIVQ